ncbi:unnamed protein product [Caenorhabditis bovis]|uniref:PI4-kinase N-terminal domain-containing protein n=1 Tax=Caenorhabditis bovis TaxID=2654633 RepID=A0A8S1ESB6_9PELO|nr:unnamed protein product [Caenorhabditis bovis]
MRDIEDFVFTNKQCTAICMAKSEKTTVASIRKFLGIAESESDLESQSLSHNVRVSLIAIGNYLLHSHGNLADELIPSLLQYLAALPHMKWIDDGLINKTDKVPVQEQFSFCFNTVLSDLAARLPTFREKILIAQADALACAVSSVIELVENSEERENKKTYIVKLVCYILGLIRTIGRFSTDYERPLISIIFPLPIDNCDGKLKSTMQKISTDEFLNSPSDVDDAEFDETRLIKVYNKHGTSFLVRQFSGGLKLKMTSHDLEKLFDTVQRLMDDEFLISLDRISTDVFRAGSVKRYPYKTISETIRLCCLCFLRDILAPYEVWINSDLKGVDFPASETFAREVNAFATDALQKLDTARASNSSEATIHINDDENCISKSRLNIHAATVALQLIAWAAVDDIDSDLICSTISPRLFTNLPQKSIISQIPIFTNSLSSLAKIAEKFPAVATATVIPILSRFLLEPAPMLTKLTSEANMGKSTMDIKNSDVGSSRKQALDSLKNSAIHAMCRSLKSALKVESKCVEACLASLSSKLFVCSNATNFVVSLVSENAIQTLGGIGVGLVDTQGVDVPDMVLQIYLQRFANPPSYLDVAMVRCLAEMWIAGAVSIHDGVSKLFTQICIESSNRVYSQDNSDSNDHRYTYGI